MCKRRTEQQTVAFGEDRADKQLSVCLPEGPSSFSRPPAAPTTRVPAAAPVVLRALMTAARTSGSLSPMRQPLRPGWR